MNICIIGLGYVGVVSAACFADLGHNVIGVEIATRKVKLLNKGTSPIIEPGLDILVQKHVKNGKLRALSSIDEAVIEFSDIYMICVGTPSDNNGNVDLGSINKVSAELNEKLKNSNKKVNLIYRSTVPPGSMKNISNNYFPDNNNVKICHHPEFLRESNAIHDFYDNPQVVASNVQNLSKKELNELFAELYHGVEHRFYDVDVKSSETIKYINNTFHALKVAFGNEIGRFCNRLGIDTDEVIKIFLDDKKLNISENYLNPGFAYGGSCLPKDLKAIQYIARHSDINLPVIESISMSNDLHIDMAFELILENNLKKVGFFGLTFKQNTDDVRESPYVKLAERLIGKGIDVIIYDENININSLMGENLNYLKEHIPHITDRLVPRFDDVFVDRELIVIAHKVDINKFGSKKILVLSHVEKDKHNNKMTIIG